MGNIQSDSQPQIIDYHKIAFQIYEIWNKDLSNLPVAQDLPRLTKNVRIYDSSGHVLNFVEEPSEEIPQLPSTTSISPDELQSPPIKKLPNSNSYPTLTHQITNRHSYSKSDRTITPNSPSHTLEKESLGRAMFSILNTLAHELNELTGPYSSDYSIIQLTPEMFCKDVDLKHHKSILNFLVKYFGAKSRTCKILKGCNQSIVAPIVTQMKLAFTDVINYKDVKGGWTIHIYFEKDQIIVKHRKIEQVFEKRKGSYEFMYKFEWLLQLNFKRRETGDDQQSLEEEDDGTDHSIHLESISMKFIDTIFNTEKQIPPEEQKRIACTIRSVLDEIKVVLDDKFYSDYAKYLKSKK